MAQRGHVPRFGDWNQNTAYTTYFDTARKGRAPGTNIINPNDPEQISELHYPPQALAPERPYPQQRESYVREKKELEGYPPQHRNGSQRATNMDQQRSRNHAGATRNPGELGYRPSPLPVTQGRAGNARQGPDGWQKPTTVPKFGDWDSADPKSSEGYTVIFDKFKEDRRAGATHSPSFPSQPKPSPTRIERPHRSDSFWKSLCPCLNPSAK